MLNFDEQIGLIQSRGLSAPATRALAMGVPDGASPDSALVRQHLLLELQKQGLHRGGPVQWAEPEAARQLAGQLRAAGIDLAWHGAAGYPEKLARRLGEDAPAWVWLAGPTHRLDGLSCAMIGSRASSLVFLTAARRLARALSTAGAAVVSGLAAGADTAALEGAILGKAGTIAVPARGILQVDLAACRGMARLSCLGLDRPLAPFSAGLAIRRNDVIAALGDGLVLVASELKGGSAYAVRWALEHGVPLWTFEAGQATPSANRQLIRAGQAEPLGLGENSTAWIERILPRLRAYAQGAAGEQQSPAATAQLDWLSS